MADERHPCIDGLTEECFRAYPEWAKQAFAYKLLNVLIPAEISKRLPKGLFPGIIGPGAILPPGWIPPPGVIVPPNYTVPPSWIPFTYFILPPGETWEQIFSPGWTEGDPFPDGVNLEPGTTLPPGWTPENPPPAWFTPGGSGFAIPPGGVLPPLYLPPGLQSPPHTPQPRSPVSGAPWFYDKFDGPTLDLTKWTEYNYLNGFNEIVSGRLKQYCTDDFSAAEIDTDEDATIPAAFELTFQLEYCGAGEHNIYIFTGAHSIDLTFEPPTTQVEFYTSTGRVLYTCADYLNNNVSWKLVYNGTLATLYQDNVLIFENVAPRVRTTNPGIIHIVTYETTIVYIDEFKIQEI